MVLLECSFNMQPGEHILYEIAYQLENIKLSRGAEHFSPFLQCLYFIFHLFVLQQSVVYSQSSLGSLSTCNVEIGMWIPKSCTGCLAAYLNVDLCSNACCQFFNGIYSLVYSSSSNSWVSLRMNLLCLQNTYILLHVFSGPDCDSP